MFKPSKFFALCAASVLFAAGAAHAAPVVYTISGQGNVASKAAEASFVASLGGSHVTETFEGFRAGAQGSPLTSTLVGSFYMDVAGSGGLCTGKLGGCAAGVAVLNAGNSPFGGRFNTTVGGANWLDSFDAQKFTFKPLAGVNSVGFFITDPNDAGGRFDLQTANGLETVFFDDIFKSGLGNGKMFYLTFTSETAISAITIFSTVKNDGFGIDDVTVGKIPEPGTLALLGLGLLAAGAIRRRSV